MRSLGVPSTLNRHDPEPMRTWLRVEFPQVCAAQLSHRPLHRCREKLKWDASKILYGSIAPWHFEGMNAGRKEARTIAVSLVAALQRMSDHG
jgi:hypothetical protein